VDYGNESGIVAFMSERRPDGKQFTPQCLVEHYRHELKVAKELKAKYVVFHV